MPPELETHVQLSNTFEAFLAAALIKVRISLPHRSLYVYLYYEFLID